MCFGPFYVNSKVPQFGILFFGSQLGTLQVFVDAVKKQYFLYSVDFIAIIHITTGKDV